jgi:hypothetical protein
MCGINSVDLFYAEKANTIFICKGTYNSPFIRIFAAIFRIVYDERQNFIGIVEHIHDALVKYIAS